MNIMLIPTMFGPIVYDIYLDGKWVGSRRTVEQCWAYIQWLRGAEQCDVSWITFSKKWYGS